MTMLARFAVSILLAAACAWAQKSSRTFEVASVKPGSDADFRNAQFSFLPGGKVIIRNIPLVMIVANAYNIPFQSPRLTGGPEWQKIATARFDVEAVAGKDAISPGPSAKARENQMRIMLQSLLEDRFKLKMRVEPKEQPVYALLVAPGGTKLHKSNLQENNCLDASGCHQLGGGQGRGLHGEAVDIADIALWVQNWTDLPVIDKTGLTDLFTINTDGWTPMRQAPPRPDGPPQGGDAGLNDPDRQTLPGIFKELGLRMESQRAVVEMFVVEHVQSPAAN